MRGKLFYKKISPRSFQKKTEKKKAKNQNVKNLQKYIDI